MGIDIKKEERPLKALANKRRLAIIVCLKKRKEMPVRDIADEIKLSFKSTSRHLSVMRAADILDREQRSLEMYYRILDDLPVTARAIISLL